MSPVTFFFSPMENGMKKLEEMNLSQLLARLVSLGKEKGILAASVPSVYRKLAKPNIFVEVEKEIRHVKRQILIRFDRLD